MWDGGAAAERHGWTLDAAAIMQEEELFAEMAVGMAGTLAYPGGGVCDFDKPRIVGKRGMGIVASVYGAVESLNVRDGDFFQRADMAEEEHAVGVVGDKDDDVVEIVVVTDGDGWGVLRDGETDGVDTLVGEGLMGGKGLRMGLMENPETRGVVRCVFKHGGKRLWGSLRLGCTAESPTN